MFIKRICLYLISLIFSLLATPLFSQAPAPKEEKKVEAKEDVPEPRKPFVRIGVDPTRYLNTLLQDATIGGVGMFIETEIKRKYFPYFETGFEHCNTTQPNYDLSARGIYFRYGIDYNLTKNMKTADRSGFLLGFHLGNSLFSQQASNIVLKNSTEQITTQIASENRSLRWAELSLGVRSAVTDHIFMGLSVRGKKRLSLSDGAFNPYYAPGFGKYYALKPTYDLNFYLIYLIDLKK